MGSTSQVPDPPPVGRADSSDALNPLVWALWADEKQSLASKCKLILLLLFFTRLA